MTVLLEELEVYRLAEDIADTIWEIAAGWSSFERETIGRQVVRSADSIGANIAEGYGRFSFQENIHYCYYARGSLMETRHWLRRAKRREILSNTAQSRLEKMMQLLGRKLNAYINSIKSEAQRWKGCLLHNDL